MSIEICVLASGSAGNCTAVRTPAGVMLIDAGLGPRTTAQRLRGTGVSVADVSALCLTKIDQKYNQAFARAETPGLCDLGNVGNAASVATLIDAFVTDGMNGVVDLIPPP